MKCFRYFSFALFVLLGVFFGSFIINQNNNVHAVDDISVTYNTTPLGGDYVFPTCTNSQCLNQFSYLIVEINNPIFNASRPRALMYFGGTLFLNINPSSSFSIYGFNNYKSSSDFSTLKFNAIDTIFDFSSGITFTLTENYQSGIIPSGSLEITENGTYDVTDYAEAVVNVSETDCPPSSGGDYHEDLVAINNSIMICAATCLVIYFFYCIYRMIIKNSGVK